MSETPSSEISDQALTPIDRRALVRDAVRYACLGGAAISAPTALVDPSLAVSIALGTVLGAVNFVLLARGVGGAIDRTVDGIERTQRERGEGGQAPNKADLEPEDIVGRPLGAGGAVRLALIVLLVAALLWYPLTQPMGLAIGVIVVLIASSVAAFRHNRAR